jgi:hypothetical protein
MLLSVKPQDRLGNKLLTALPAEEYKRILPDLEQTFFSFGESIYEASERPNYAYFPPTSVVSLVYTVTELSNQVYSLGRFVTSPHRSIR